MFTTRIEQESDQLFSSCHQVLKMHCNFITWQQVWTGRVYPAGKWLLGLHYPSLWNPVFSPVHLNKPYSTNLFFHFIGVKWGVNTKLRSITGDIESSDHTVPCEAARNWLNPVFDFNKAFDKISCLSVGILIYEMQRHIPVIKEYTSLRESDSKAGLDRTDQNSTEFKSLTTEPGQDGFGDSQDQTLF